MNREWKQLKENQEVRQALIAIRARVKEDEELAALRKLFREEPRVLTDKLWAEDPKIRKNAALLLGALGVESSIQALFEAYEREDKRFVKSAYLKALTACGCKTYLEPLKARQRELLHEERTPESEKHIREELEALNILIYQAEPHKRHVFTGMEKPVDVILTTEREYQEVTRGQILNAETALLRAGVKVKRGKIADILPVRTFRELLFCLNLQGEVERETGAEQLAASNLSDLLKELHEGEGPYFFRIECKSKMSLEERSRFTKRLAGDLEALTGGKLINSTSDYEAELRLIETRGGGFYPLLKLYTLPDKRFSYRKCSVAASMQPVRAALLMELAKPWMRENARVLDPFCGVGTLLLERNYLVHADTLYGVDSFGEAIRGARENAGIAGVPAHFVNRDFFTFSHGYRFDELITDFPSSGKNLGNHDMEMLYQRFFNKAGELLRPGACLFLYSHDRGFLKAGLRAHKEMELLKEWSMGEKEEAWFFALRFNG